MFAYLPHWLVGCVVRLEGSVRGARGPLQTWASSVRERLACRWSESSHQTLPPYHSRSPGRMRVSVIDSATYVLEVMSTMYVCIV